MIPVVLLFVAISVVAIVVFTLVDKAAGGKLSGALHKATSGGGS